MLSILSPAKTLDFDTAPSTRRSTQPLFLDDAATLVGAARNMTPEDIQSLMGVSEKIAQLNHERFMNWAPDFSLDNAKQAVLAFKGDVYTGLRADTLSTKELTFAQKHLRILSGLYGLLRPLDLMQPYRLEMGTSFAVNGSKNLYDFWKSVLTDQLNSELQNDELVVNLASKEYASAVDFKSLNARVVSPIFKDYKNGKLKIISFYAKKARGLMARFLIDNQAQTASDLLGFSTGGYVFSSEHTTDSMAPVFVR